MSEMNLSRKDWSVFARSRGGNIGITRNVSLAEAAKCKAILLPHRTGMWEAFNSDIIAVEICGPEGWDGCLGAASHDYSQGTATTWKGDDDNKGRPICFGNCTNCGEHFWMYGDPPTTQEDR